MTTVRQFVSLAYRLIDPSNPTVPLTDDMLGLGITILNQLLVSYGATGLMQTIASTQTCPLAIGQQYVTVGPPPTPPNPPIYDINIGRLANLDSAWLLLDGVSYPLIDKSRDDFLASFHYEPLEGLPRFVLVYPDTQFVNIRLYPAPSQFFQFYLRGKYQLSPLTSADTLISLPDYYQRYFTFACGKDFALYKGRASAWTPELQKELDDSRNIMISASEVNLTITGDRASLLNGSWRVRAGI